MPRHFIPRPCSECSEPLIPHTNRNGLCSRCYLRGYQRALYQSDTEAGRDKARAQRAKNPEAAKLAWQTYRIRHPEVGPEYSRQWRKDNRLKKRDQDNRRRARLRQLPREVIDWDVVYDRDGGICGICGKKVVRKAMSLDHILPLSAGGTHIYSNVRTSHLKCNLSRRELGSAQLRLLA